MTDLGALRRRAFDTGYRMLGSRSDADDIAQETLLRVRDPITSGDVRSPEAFTTTVATRLAIDHLRSARARREEYLGPWLPEPIIERDADAVELADSLSYGLLVVLETLGPVERAALLLHDVFGFGYDEIARHPIRGRDRVSRFVVHLVPRFAHHGGLSTVTINGEPWFVVDDDGHVYLAGTIEAVDGRILAVRWVVNPTSCLDHWPGRPGPPCEADVAALLWLAVDHATLEQVVSPLAGIPERGAVG